MNLMKISHSIEHVRFSAIPCISMDFEKIKTKKKELNINLCVSQLNEIKNFCANDENQQHGNSVHTLNKVYRANKQDLRRNQYKYKNIIRHMKKSYIVNSQ